jgi:hypothetical protein
MHKLIIGYDQHAENPRQTNDYFSQIFSAHRTVTGDINATGNYRSLEAEYLGECGKNNIEVPIYLYEHSGIAINTTGFSCPWDSGKLGYIFASKEKVREEFGWKRITPKRIEFIKECLTNEVEEWGQWLSGEVYRYRIEDADGEVVDSLCDCYDKQTIKDYIDESLFPNQNIDEVIDNAFENLED